MNPAVSVVMPVFDQEVWLGAAIDSLRRQRLTDWELLIVDDGSGDGSRAVMEAYRGRDPDRIFILEHPGRARRGAAASRNLAIGQARGRYLAFLDADDLYSREKLAEEVGRLDATPEAAMLYGPALWRWQDGRCADRIDRVGIEVGRVHRPPDLARRVLIEREGDVPCTCAVLIRSEAARAAGGFEESFQLYEDQTLWAKLFLRHGVFVASAAHSIYRQHPGSTSAHAEAAGQYDFWQPHPAQREFLEWLGREAGAAGAADAAFERALRRALLSYRLPWLGRADAKLRRAMRGVRRRRRQS